MILDLDDPGLSRALMLFRTREVDHKVMLERIVRPGMRIFDIGGNIGYYPLMELTLLAGSGQLVVIEPVPQNVALLNAIFTSMAITMFQLSKRQFQTFRVRKLSICRGNLTSARFIRRALQP